MNSMRGASIGISAKALILGAIALAGLCFFLPELAHAEYYGGGYSNGYAASYNRAPVYQSSYQYQQPRQIYPVYQTYQLAPRFYVPTYTTQYRQPSPYVQAYQPLYYQPQQQYRPYQPRSNYPYPWYPRGGYNNPPSNNPGTTTPPVTNPPVTTPSTYALTVMKSGTGTGTVSGSGISCGSTCMQSGIAGGSTISFIAAPDAGSTFTGWGGVCSGTGFCNVFVTTNLSLTATFSAIPVTPPVTQTQPLHVSCSPSAGYIDISQHVAWTATATGGTGSGYSYVWTSAAAQSSGGSLTDQTVFVSYATPGNKEISVTVSDGQNTASGGCSVIITEDGFQIDGNGNATDTRTNTGALCTDTDGGQNLNVAGTVTASNIAAGIYTTSFTDYSVTSTGAACSGDSCTSVYEGFCAPDNTPSDVLMACPFGHSANGACTQ